MCDLIIQFKNNKRKNYTQNSNIIICYLFIFITLTWVSFKKRINFHDLFFISVILEKVVHILTLPLGKN
jgi:hypothetical protein